VVPLFDDDHAYLGAAVLVQNVSMQRSMQDHFIQSEKMASVAEMAVGVAHEINNPLYIIQNYLQLIKETVADPRVTERIDKIDQEATQIMETVLSLLSFSRVPQQVHPAIDLREVGNDVATLLRHNLKKKSIKLTLDFHIDSATARADENKLKQVVINLMMNSKDAVLDGGQIHITSSASAPEADYELRVSDNGYGIPKDVADSIFDPFFSTVVTRKNTGLGLPICRGIIEDHGGTIDFTSFPGRFTECRASANPRNCDLTAHESGYIIDRARAR